MARTYIGRSANAVNANLDTTFSVPRGGTGKVAFTIGALLVGAGAALLTEIVPGANGAYLKSNGAAWGATAGGVPAADITGAFPSLTVSGALTAATGVFSSTITATAKGHLFGSASGASGGGVYADANIKLYDNSSTNWAGIGSDLNGNMWFKTGIAGVGFTTLYTYTGTWTFPAGIIATTGTFSAGLAVGAGVSALQALTATTGLFSSTVTAAAVAVGTSPATGGQVRLPYQGTLTWRNAANSANIDALYLATNTTLSTNGIGLTTGPLSATSGSFTNSLVLTGSSTQALIAFDTFSGTVGDNIQIFFARGAVPKWRIGTNIDGLGVDSFNLYNEAASAMVLTANLSTRAVTVHNGFNVLAGTSALQALTATTITASGATAVQALTATTGRFTDSASGQPVIVNNGNASGSIRLIYTGQRGGTDKWHIGVDASDNATIFNASGATSNLTWTDAGAFTFRAGITATTGTFSGALSATTGTFSGVITANSGMTVTAAQSVGWATRGSMSWPSDGVLTLYDNAATSFGRVQLGGTSAAFPAFKRVGAGISVRTANDGGDADFSAAAATFSSGLTITAVGANIKGSNGTTPIVQITNGTNMPTAITSGGVNFAVVGNNSGTGPRFIGVGDAGGTGVRFIGSVSGGTVAAPSATPNGQLLALFGGRGYGLTWTSTTDAASMFITSTALWAAGSNPAKIEFVTTAPASITPALALTLSDKQSVVVGALAALGTTATDGFLYIPTCAGTPTGVPTAYTGKVAMIYDTTNNKLAIYNGAWKQTVALT